MHECTGEEDRSNVNKQVLEFMWLISRGVEQAVEQRMGCAIPL